ncbi:hypothetical protein PTSG_06964 [Salpingoeca rosetta]|uniref:Sulfatase N-terminal domain-containing protein n=1 Tax=Salpingoeca rosetta (strain ATCC 50818 / BSB-021) TaxID=946362 RepID=F2UFB4_SALR5|nr:uncharacterized protein PTSG_06964 [Salpingoeca rosetta]EGD75314.1 hypothetical protein PTSG_06964 [Salpingoeca rosetta]|eukprot:XP_004992367.1 hypothetical protein PTSG_06964 [Salpingoeca rosetta]
MMTTSRAPAFAAAIALLMCCCCSCCWMSGAQAEPAQPNILILLLDDVGADRFTFYGSNVDSSANINELAEKAVVFDAFFAQPICGPSRACLLSGRLTSNTKAYGNGHKRNEDFDESECTLGATFQEAGYRTALFGKAHASAPYLSTYNESCGFGKYAIWARQGPRYHNSTIQTNIGTGDLSEFDALVAAAREVENVGPSRTLDMKNTYHPHLNRELAKAHITASKAEGKPFLIHMPMLLTHGPTPDKEDDPSLPLDMHTEQGGNELFNQRLMVADAVIGDILRHLEVEGMQNDTIVLVTGDNGTPRGYDAVVNGVKTRNGKRHADRAEGTRVPLLVYYPPVLDTAPRTVKSVATLYDILPTLVDAAGVSGYPAGKDEPDGSSFWPLVTGQRKKTGEWAYLFSESRDPHAVVRNRKTIIASDGNVYRERKWYDPVRVSPELVCQRKKIFRRMKRMVFEAWKLDINVTLPGSDTALPPDSCAKIVCNPDTSLPECVYA